jgi:general secretion pathway protein G
MERPIQTGRARRRRAGFTFVEVMVVVTIIVLLISMAIPIYNRAITRTKESVLSSNLYTIRTVIDNYCYDRGKCPQNLQDLVSDGYLRAIPEDPITKSTNWQTMMEDSTKSVNQQEPGIWEVHSGSDKTGSDGRPYSEW